MHGVDEFFGNLYHLNAEEEPEHPDYPDQANFPVAYAAVHPRGVLHSWATDEDSGATDERYGPIGKQRIEDTGPLTRNRMETIDGETVAACIDFIRRQNDAGVPFFTWMNTTHMHFRTHPKPESVGQAGRWQSPYHDTMIDHDGHVGQLLDALDELGIADDTS
jgi:arylsulfatase